MLSLCESTADIEVRKGSPPQLCAAVHVWAQHNTECDSSQFSPFLALLSLNGLREISGLVQFQNANTTM